MQDYEGIHCSDGIFRWFRKNPVKKQKPVNAKSDIPAELENFDLEYSKIAKVFFSEEMYFCSKNWTRKKILMIARIIQNLGVYKIKDIDLFLFAQFEYSKISPKSIWPSNIASLNSIKVYQDWISQFANHIEARAFTRPKNIEDIMLANHKNYLHYRNEVGWSDEVIYQFRGNEFDPLYLLSNPKFIELYEANPGPLINKKKDIEDALEMLNNNKIQKEYWDIVRRIHCKPETSLISCSKTKF